MFILCRITGGALAAGMETVNAGFFGLGELPPLSVERNTESQIRLMFDYLSHPGKAVIFD
jgi:hypothetical protein